MNTNFLLRMTVKLGIHVVLNSYLLSCGMLRLKPKILAGHLLPFKDEVQTALFKDPVRTAL
jgi:hypothetical protein